ncbi:methyltransferase domain-containing protein [Candidatus Methylacidiphilum infernorum]|uniref:Methyltransferase domain-containing protein n=1 Tax=Candidatus Methylacidiphilum infernorum TaxID=511746 RepID=A0ABX7PUZ1_9BACT|nr:methyltransferase domain-containing protein [Candidatus Methylacidiphilum infernorum]QSR86424.1 methyltransferase domain-containing protein [Candidatus Methylacidiphilum infernorum]
MKTKSELPKDAGTPLTAWRRKSAEMSGGKSGEHIYELIDRVIEEQGSKGNVIDFGAGQGTYTQRLFLSGRFEQVIALDLLPRPSTVSDSVQWIVQDLNQPTDLPGEAFDLIVAAEVIEHLENPRALAREWFRLLRPGGSLILTTPNNESWRAIASLIFKGHFSLFLDHSYPAHITALVRKDIERILSEAGFTMISLSDTPIMVTFLFCDAYGRACSVP